MREVLLLGIAETVQADVERGDHMQQIRPEGPQLVLDGGHAGQRQPALGIQKKGMLAIGRIGSAKRSSGADFGVKSRCSMPRRCKWPASR